MSFTESLRGLEYRWRCAQPVASPRGLVAVPQLVFQIADLFQFGVAGSRLQSAGSAFSGCFRCIRMAAKGERAVRRADANPDNRQGCASMRRTAGSTKYPVPPTP
jgi:hypothetical protein